VQQEVVPLAPPWSHASPTPSTTPLPQNEVKVTVTKCPSFDCVRDGEPAYPQAGQLVVVPFCCPTRTAASHEFERTLPLHVNVRLWLCPTPLLTRLIVALAVWSKGVSVLPPPLPMLPGAPRLRVPLESAMFELPVTPLMSARPSQPDTSLRRFMSPVRRVAIVTR
jgi:hypothetical protein